MFIWASGIYSNWWQCSNGTKWGGARSTYPEICMIGLLICGICEVRWCFHEEVGVSSIELTSSICLPDKIDWYLFGTDWTLNGLKLLWIIIDILIKFPAFAQSQKTSRTLCCQSMLLLHDSIDSTASIVYNLTYKIWNNAVRVSYWWAATTISLAHTNLAHKLPLSLGRT